MNTEQQVPALKPSGFSDDQEMEIDLLELLSVFLANWYLILAGLLAGGILAGAITFLFMEPTYTGSAKLYMVSNSRDTIVDLSDFNIGNSLSSDYEQLLKVRPILEEVIEEEDLDYSYEQLKGMVTISTISNTRILQISTVSHSPKEAMVISNALADKAVEEIPILMDTVTPNIAERAIIPTQKSGPSMTKNTLIGAMLGMLLVAGILTVLFLMDDTMGTAEEVEKALGVMPLSVVPEGSIPGKKVEKKKAVKRKRRKNTR